jgi:hypothetical protein
MVGRIGTLACAHRQALASPKQELFRVEIKKQGEAAVVRFAVDNTGWLPTYVTKMGLQKKLCRGVIGEIFPPEGVEVVSGLVRQEGPQLEGRSGISASGFGWQLNATDHRHVFEWTLRGEGEIELVARHDRAGTVRTRAKI